MKKLLIFHLLLIGLLIACAPTTGDTVNEDPMSDESTEESAPFSTVQPEQSDDEAVIEGTAVPAETIAAEARDQLLNQKATPDIVDLGDLTPNPTVEGAPIEQPAPGTPLTIEALVEEMKIDLSNKVDVAPEDIEVVKMEEMSWRDSSLGCPLPGMSYLQVITPGFRVTLQTDDEVYFYHTRGTSNFIQCVDPSQESVDGPQPTPPDQ